MSIMDKIRAATLESRQTDQKQAVLTTLSALEADARQLRAAVETLRLVVDGENFKEAIWIRYEIETKLKEIAERKGQLDDQLASLAQL